MKKKIERRLAQLKEEQQSGQKVMVELDAKRSNLQSTLLRISGAIQVLEELLTGPEDPGNGSGESLLPPPDSSLA